MKKNKWLFCLLLFFIGALCGYFIIPVNKGTVEKKSNIGDVDSIARLLIQEFEDISLVTAQSTCKPLFNEENRDRTTQFLDILQKGGLKLDSISDFIFFRFSYENCRSCLDSELVNILEIQKNMKVRFCIIGSFIDRRDLEIFKSTYVINAKVIAVPVDYFSIEVEKRKAPFYFRMSKDLITKNVLAIDKHNPELSFKWLSSFVLE